MNWILIYWAAFLPESALSLSLSHSFSRCLFLALFFSLYFSLNLSRTWHDCFVGVIWIFDMCIMYRSRVWHASFILLRWTKFWLAGLHFRRNALSLFSSLCLSFSLARPLSRSNSLSPCLFDVTWLIHMCDMNRGYALRESFMCVTWIVHISDMTRLCGEREETWGTVAVSF